MPAGLLDTRSVLVVEDDYFVATALSAMLEAEGARVVAVIGWLDEALEYVAKAGFPADLVFLDVDLHGEKSYPVADALVSLGVRFTFMTGFGKDALDKNYLGFPRCQKPFSLGELLAAVEGR